MCSFDVTRLWLPGGVTTRALPDGSTMVHQNGVHVYTFMHQQWVRFEQGAQFYVGLTSAGDALRLMGINVARFGRHVAVYVHGHAGIYRSLLHRHKVISLVNGEYPDSVAANYKFDSGLVQEMDYNLQRIKKFAATISRLGGVDTPCAPRPLSLEELYSDDAYTHVYDAVVMQDYTDGFLTLMKEWSRECHTYGTYDDRVNDWLVNFETQLMFDTGAIK